jgi:hypothetical protein
LPTALTGIQSVTGGAANMTITSGTGNSRTLSLQTTTSGGVATTALLLDATQGASLTGNFQAGAAIGDLGIALTLKNTATFATGGRGSAIRFTGTGSANMAQIESTTTGSADNTANLVLRTSSGGVLTAVLTLSPTLTATFASSVSTGTPNGGVAAAWKMGEARSGVALTVSTTAGVQLDVAGTLYTLAVLTTNP